MDEVRRPQVHPGAGCSGKTAAGRCVVCDLAEMLMVEQRHAIEVNDVAVAVALSGVLCALDPVLRGVQ